MLEYIKKLLLDSSTGTSHLIYIIVRDPALRKKVTYNPIGDFFEIPISELQNITRYCNNGSYYDEVIEGTPIHWGKDFDSFYFWIE